MLIWTSAGETRPGPNPKSSIVKIYLLLQMLIKWEQSQFKESAVWRARVYDQGSNNVQTEKALKIKTM